ncbi:aspartyl protease family protein [Pontibacter chinhatensis]|uniref:Aspartyl protease n=1 Tax=Pontibacter chinhatensis TaxID=1436961 RepID=A0A1I2MEP4_9BACT|nr:aspartyl protease family protein [Pontibacter chinhatensis]SFF89400.1 Aspartyl protease [Pontibacter chinhatensis]
MRVAGYRAITCAFLLMLLSTLQVWAQLPQPSDTVYLTSGRNKIILPFKLVHNLIVLPVRVNNSQSLNFILDSGVQNVLITHLHFDDSLDLQQTSRIKIRGLGEGYTIEALHSVGNTISMPGVAGENLTVYVLLEEVFDLSMRMGMPVHGIIGYDIFKNFIVKINYSTQTITLYKPDYKVRKKRKAEEYALHIEDSKPYLYGSVRQHNGDSLDVKLIVDTGASHSLSLYLPTNERLSLPPKVMEAYLGRGLGGDINGKIGRLPGFRLGKYNIENLTANYPDEQAVKHALNIAGRNGNLGSEILKRFTVIFDYPHQKLTLIPNRKFKEPFNYNMAGFEVSTPLPGINFYTISNVVDDSPAKLVGMQPGDQLLYINGRNCTELQLQELLNMLDSRPGSKLRLRLKRAKEIIDVNVVLQSKI